jgi:Amidohydrolase family
MKLLYFIGTILLLQSCNRDKHFDLAIENAKIFDAINGTVITGKTILINADTISDIVDKSDKFSATNSINAYGKLVTSGFIDTHIHLTSIIGDNEDAPEFINKDSIIPYRRKLADIYLKYGVTTIKEVGQPEKWIPVSLSWQKNPAPQYPDIFISGGALISDEDRTPYLDHVEVKSPEEATQKIEEYHNLGIKYLKLYWRLREPEMKSVVKRAKELNMNMCAHIDNHIIGIDKVLDLGVKNFEHSCTITSDIIVNKENDKC